MSLMADRPDRDVVRGIVDNLVSILPVLPSLPAEDAALQVGAAIAGPVIAALTQREWGRVDEIRSVIVAEVERRVEEGDRPRDDLHSDPFHDAWALVEGTVWKARASYEGKKVQHLGLFVSNVLFDSEQDLGEAFFHLSLVEHLTYHQLLLLGLFERITAGAEAPIDSDVAFGHRPGRVTEEVMLPLLDLFQLGLLMEEQAEERVAVGGLSSRYDGTNISMTNPRHIRLSLTGGRLARTLGLNNIPAEDLIAVRLRLRAHCP